VSVGLGMKECLRCGKKFNLLQRAVGEAKDHMRHCTAPEKKKNFNHLAGVCRGCPAGCYERIEYEDKT